MEPEELESYRRAGKMASEVREWTKDLVKNGASILEIAEKTEARIKELGGEIAFPVNVCINDVTAHYTPKHNDETLLSKEDVVSIDLGVHVDGYIADTAYTVDLSGNYPNLISANKEALEKAIKLARPKAKVSDIGEAVQGVLSSAGYKPIENLTGHEIKQYDLHAGLSIPSIKVPYDWEIEEGMVLAIEPFATDGYGRVIESRNSEIFSLQQPKPTRNRDARDILAQVMERQSLPFAQRWLAEKISPLKLDLALRELLRNGSIKAYPVLHEKEKGVVSQFEHTVIVTADGCEVTTR